MYSITLQNAGGDNVISSGDILGRLNFSASAESDGGSATYIASHLYCEADGAFTSTSNPASLVFATSSTDDLPSSGRLKISSDGHFVPLASGAYDLGSSSHPFRNLYIDNGHLSAPSGMFDVISFNVDDESILTKGQLSWDDTEGSLDIGLTDNTTIHIGEHEYFRIRNETGNTLYKGQVVYASGVHANGIIQPALYVADGSIREVRFMGIMLEDVNHQNNGYAIDFGHLEEMDLDGSATNYAVGDETWVAGDILYVHPTVAGKLTKNEPKHSISVAIILDVGTGNGNGRMFVRPISYGHINDNHDVNTSGLLDNQFLVYNSGLDDWQPSSGLYYVDGDLGIGTAIPDRTLDVSGNGRFIYNNKPQGLSIRTTNTDPSDNNNYGLYHIADFQTTTSAADKTYYGFLANVRTKIDSGVSVSGNSLCAGFTCSALRNFVPTENDDGYITSLYGFNLNHGHHSNNPRTSTITENSYGSSITFYATSGTITNAYDLYLNEPPTNNATITNRYGIYINHTADNYFRGEFKSGIDNSGIYPFYGARAWCQFNGAGGNGTTITPNGSKNISSITDGGVGIYTINFATSMPDGNYAALASCNALTTSDQQINVYSHLTSSVNLIYRESTTLKDPTKVSVAIFR